MVYSTDMSFGALRRIADFNVAFILRRISRRESGLTTLWQQDNA
jgi:hypothetical protein